MEPPCSLHGEWVMVTYQWTKWKQLILMEIQKIALKQADHHLPSPELTVFFNAEANVESKIVINDGRNYIKRYTFFKRTLYVRTSRPKWAKK